MREKTEINQQRKLAHTEAGNHIRAKQQERWRYEADNAKLEPAIRALRKEVEEMKKVAKKRRLMPKNFRDPTLPQEVQKELEHGDLRPEMFDQK